MAKTKPSKGFELLREHVYGSRRGEDAVKSSRDVRVCCVGGASRGERRHVSRLK